MRSVVIGLVIAMLAAAPALAGNWMADSDTSSLTFEGKQANETFKGAFKRFIIDIQFDEAALDKSHIQVTVDMKSAIVDGKDRQDALLTSDWLAVDQFPNAEFNSTSITKTGDHQFVAAGNLTIHGISKPVTLPSPLKPDGKSIIADGTVNLARNDYKIGQGRWTDDKWIAFPVSVHYMIRASQ